MEFDLRLSNGRRFAPYASLRMSKKELHKKVVGTDPMGMTREQVLNDLERHYTIKQQRRDLICYNISRSGAISSHTQRNFSRKKRQKIFT
jgi:hypothetical protein